MPYLNWKNATSQQLAQDVLTAQASGGTREFQLSLKLSGDLVQELIPQLQDIFDQGGPELRVDLPKEWIMFWKSRAGESRVLMAHPQPDEWVSTMALNTTHGKKLIDALKALQPGQTVSIESLGSVGPVSNVDVLITRTS
jgi:hypothetical protein